MRSHLCRLTSSLLGCALAALLLPACEPKTGLTGSIANDYSLVYRSQRAYFQGTQLILTYLMPLKLDTKSKGILGGATENEVARIELDGRRLQKYPDLRVVLNSEDGSIFAAGIKRYSLSQDEKAEFIPEKQFPLLNYLELTFKHKIDWQARKIGQKIEGHFSAIFESGETLLGNFNTETIDF